MYEPILRYAIGYSQELLKDLHEHLQNHLKLTTNQIGEIQEIFERQVYEPLEKNMSIEDGIEYTRFLVELAINRYKYYDDEPDLKVGGKTIIGIAAANDKPFKILDNNGNKIRSSILSFLKK